MDYYIVINGQKAGPFPESELLNHGLTANTPVWCEGMADWQNASTVPALAHFFNAPQPTPCYQTPTPNYAPGQPTYQNAPIPPKSWLVESILVTLFCCLPLGIVGIIKASSVTSLYSAGNYAGAEQASKDAGRWTKIGFLCGAIGIILYVIFIVIIGVGSAFSGLQ